MLIRIKGYSFSKYSAAFGMFILLLFPRACLSADASNALHVKVGIYDNKPIVFRTRNGSYEGVALDVLKSVARKENWKLEDVYAPWKSVYAKLEAGEIDLLVGIAYSEERARKFDYTHETLINNWGVIYRKPSVSITSFSDLSGKRIALMQNSIHSRVFRKTMSKFNFEFSPVLVNSYIDALQKVQDGQADAAVINRVMSILAAPKYEVLETGIIFNPVEVRYAAPKGRDGAVLAAIDRALAAQKQDENSEYHASLHRWLGVATQERTPLWLTAVLGAVLVAVVLLLVSNYLIRRQVHLRTRELAESELRFRQMAENIKEIFWIGSPDWSQIFYVSPMFETVYGMSRDKLYDNPMSWIESVHPNDRTRVEEAVEKKSRGDLNNPAFPEFRIISGDRTTRWILARVYPIRDVAGRVIRIAGIAEDITERKKSEETIRFMAYHDPLTRLTNRHAFEYQLTNLIERSRDGDEHHALLYIDLDQFKVVNDTCGHTAGDELLKELAALLLRTLHEDAVLARLGGDEFAVLMEYTTLNDAYDVACRLLDVIQKFRFTWEGSRFTIGASIGMVMIGGLYKSMSELLSAADMACYAAKESGRNRINVYREDDADLVQRHGEMQWVSRLTEALEENRFVLYQQAIVPLQDHIDTQDCREFLLRMQDEDGNLIPPGAFLPSAERYDLMKSLDRWVIRNVFSFLQNCEETAGSNHAGNSIAFINLSAQALNDDEFVEFVLEQMRIHSIAGGRVCFEITETVAISNLAKAMMFMGYLRERGILFALDDFGTGMSSFSYLNTLPVDFLKIDGYFIRDLFTNPMNAAIVDAITLVGHTAKMQLIAEWVESEEIRDKLVEIGIDFAQGYAIERPRPL